MVHSIGADYVIDYTQEDFAKNGQQYNLILAVNGYHPISDYLGSLNPEGVYVVSGGSMLQLFQAAFQRRRVSKTENQKIYIVSLAQCQGDLILLKGLLESGKIVPVIDGCYPLSQTAQAFQYFEKEHAKGKVVIMVKQNGKS